MIKRILFLTTVVFLIGCVSKEVEIPEDIIDADTFTAIMIDVQLREGMTSNTGRNHRDVARQRKMTRT